MTDTRMKKKIKARCPSPLPLLALHPGTSFISSDDLNNLRETDSDVENECQTEKGNEMREPNEEERLEEEEKRRRREGEENE